jgi:hypothetical protein
VKGEEFVDSVWYHMKIARGGPKIELTLILNCPSMISVVGQHQLGCGDGRSTLDRT